ncbi:MAG TPA: hypothetical protein VGE14_13020 [Marmoricola sp.]
MPTMRAVREFGRRVAGNLSEGPTMLVFLWTLWFGPARELWIGDSHTVSFNRPPTYGTFVTGPQGQIIHRLGARLMWSLAENGFPRSSQRLAWLARRLGRQHRFVPMFLTGEVDVRCHLAGRPDEDYAFVAAYVDRCVELGRRFRAQKIVVVVPPPPCDWPPAEAAYPILGTIEQRLEVFGRLRTALQLAVAATPGVSLLDFTDLIAGPDGALRLDYTDDGCHTNGPVIALARRRVHALVHG